MVSELRTIKKLKKDAVQTPAVGLGTELALAEISKKLATKHTPTYARQESFSASLIVKNQ